jgi:hypothetical protein
MTGFAILAGISLAGIVAVVGWVLVVSMGIRREDRATLLNVDGTGPGRIARIARQTTGLHGV